MIYIVFSVSAIFTYLTFDLILYPERYVKIAKFIVKDRNKDKKNEEA